MASASVSHLIIFIASMVIAAGVVGTATGSVDRFSGAIEDRSLDVSEEVRTDMEIISDAGSPVYNVSGNDNVTLLVKNTGSRNLKPDANLVDVLVDGRYVASVTVEPISGTTWERHEVVRLHIDAGTLSPGDHRVKVVVDGDEEVFTFRA
jgi:flagellar protein FlaG